MDAQMCKICGQRHHRYEPHRFPSREAAHEALGLTMAAPDRPRSNARSPSRRKPGTDKAAQREADHTSRPQTQSHSTPDTAPPQTLQFTNREAVTITLPNIPPLDPRSMTIDQLRPFFNEWMRRKMAAKRAQGRDLNTAEPSSKPHPSSSR